MKNLLIVFIITAVCVFSGCSEKKKSDSDVDGNLNIDSDTEVDIDEFEETDVEPDETENILDNDIEIEDIEIEDDEITDDMETDDETDEESDDDAVDPVPSVIYVKHDAAGADNGSSWANAFTSFHNALESSIAGDQIWVAYGTYYPESVHGLVTMDDVSDVEEFNRYKHFRMKNGVEIYGGFAGTETELSQRDFENDNTILSCDLGEIDEEYDNCFHIFYHPAGINLDNSAVLDGFLMEGGYADDVEPHDAGSVMYNDGSSPVVKNGWIYWNYSYKGAVFYNKDSSMKVMDTQFVNNDAPYSKGGVFYNENSEIEISGCTFNNNRAEGDNDSNGGAIYSTGGKTVITDTVFNLNKAQIGGAIFIESGDVEITNCTFDENKSENGGAINLNNSSALISDTMFKYNTTYSYGSTDGRGGAIRMIKSELTVLNSIFFQHIAGDGGAIYSGNFGEDTSTLKIINSAFSINKMIDQGGALFLHKTNTNIVNSVFFKNYWGYSSTGTYGGAIYKANNGSLTVTNSIFKSNNAGTGKHIHDAAGNATVTYSCIVDSTVYPGTGNINTEPLLIEPEWTPLNFGLQAESPCIDTGSNAPFDAGNIAEGITKDMSIIKGKDASPSAIVDMGAVEFKPAP
jgi:predicted outer membrane repeat protein